MGLAQRVFLALFACLASAAAARADTLRCGRKLVASGASLYEVQANCGAPDFQHRRIEVRTTQRWLSEPCPPESKQTRCGRSIQDSQLVVLEDWYYDFGPLSFVQCVTFEQGRLVAVTPGARGSKRTSPSARRPVESAPAAPLTRL